MSNDNHVILIVEDSDEDFYAADRAFKNAGIANNVYRCIDGEDALNYLYQREKYTDSEIAPKPTLILLDLNLPKINGKNVLSEIKKNPALSQIPVVILTTSDNEMDIESCYELGANSYIKKPVEFDDFMKVVKELKNYWLEIVLLPKK
ncbi:MAG: two-component system response regulator [Gammaproteobacteria bacterium CG_4_10_14_0_8_um_filter_38_16]|nr:MAG: two-component system response regulator [Gammaproteobacteria bacterium CG_4_10_14_0_8_um_filter_38_16]PJA04135.1 MAG: two-component system response regulator [Gammaproteobacteria bacterium CG_4_10_14_0_2_um_filter_38_22]PJB09998.1 MAG: two-component system response regulator [Gammaproteobacteria bacterium CG_4_9_14_3_um_filter_38_9]